MMCLLEVYGLAIETDRQVHCLYRLVADCHEMMHRMLREDLAENCPGPGRQAHGVTTGAVDAAFMGWIGAGNANMEDSQESKCLNVQAAGLFEGIRQPPGSQH